MNNIISLFCGYQIANLFMLMNLKVFFFLVFVLGTSNHFYNIIHFWYNKDTEIHIPY